MPRRRDATGTSDGPNGRVDDGGGGDGIEDCIEDDHNLLSDHSHSDDHALLSFPEITSRSDEDPAQAKSQVEAAPPPPPPPASTASQPLGASGDRSRVATNQTHPDFVPPSALFPTNMTEGVSNRRLSWAERR